MYNDTYTEKIYMIRSYINTIYIFLSSMTFDGKVYIPQKYEMKKILNHFIYLFRKQYYVVKRAAVTDIFCF